MDPTFVERLRGRADVLPPGRRVLAPEAVARVHRTRLIVGMLEAARDKGYADATIADVVARAQVSRRTFYEHFADKQACFLAAYEAAMDLLLEQLADAAAAPGLSWSQRVEAGVRVYLQQLADEPALSRMILIDVLALGPEALARRRAVHDRLAEVVLALIERYREELPPGWTMDPLMATALIGAMNELLRMTLERDDARSLPELTGIGVALVRALLAGGDWQT